MAQIGIPDFTIGTSVSFAGNVNFNGSYRGQEVFNSEYIDRSNAELKVEKEIARVNNRYGEEWRGKDAIGGVTDVSNDPTRIFKISQDFYLHGGIKVETYSTIIEHKGTSPYEMVVNKKGIEGFSFYSPIGKISTGIDGSFAIGNDILSTGVDKYGNLTIDISFSWNRSSHGFTLYVSKQPLDNLIRNINLSPRGTHTPIFVPNPYLYPIPY